MSAKTSVNIDTNNRQSSSFGTIPFGKPQKNSSKNIIQNMLEKVVSCCSHIFETAYSKMANRCRWKVVRSKTLIKNLLH